MKKIFSEIVLIVLCAFMFSINICFADHSKEIFVFRGTADEVGYKGEQIFSWYVMKDSMKLTSNKKIAFAFLFAYDENDKWRSKFDLTIKFSFIPSPKKMENIDL